MAAPASTCRRSGPGSGRSSTSRATPSITCRCTTTSIRARWPSVEGYLASSRELDALLDAVGAIVDEAAAATGSQRRIGLSVDEWNVWRIAEHEASVAALPPDAIHEVPPAIAEDTHDLTDALVVGSLLISLLRHADRVRIACVAQLVNVIPLIRTVDGGPAWRQTSAHVFAMAARSARGVVLRLDLDGPMLAVPDDEPIAAIEATAIHDVEAGRLTILAVNRATRPLALALDVRRFGRVRVEDGASLDDPDPAAANSADHRTGSCPGRSGPRGRRTGRSPRRSPQVLDRAPDPRRRGGSGRS